MAKGDSHWIHDHRVGLKAFMRITFGLVWLIDGFLKFQPGMPDVITQMIIQAGQGQPTWIMPWFTFWAGVVGTNPAFWVYLIGVGETLIGIALILGGMRKVTYLVGVVLSFFIWGVPEGFGGPYGPSSTDIGTGIIYALVFLALIMINTGYGTSKYSIDSWIEKHIKWWHKLAEFD